MDENLLLLDFRLLVDRASEILEKLPTSRRIEAVNYGLARIKTKFPDVYEQVRRECYGDESRTPRATTSVKEEGIQLWGAERRSSVANDILSKADLNQNFEKIMCKEEVKFADDDFNDTILACSSATRLTNNLEVHSSDTRSELLRFRFPGESSSSNCILPARTSAAALSPFSIVSSYGSFGRSKISLMVQNLLRGRFSTRLPWEHNLRKFRFHAHNFFVRFLRFDDDFNRNAFRQQILTSLEFAVDHRKPFLRKFLIKLVLAGATIPGVRPPPRIVEGIAQSELSSPAPTLENTYNSLSPRQNGVLKEYMDYEESSVTEETTQNTDSSEENARMGPVSPINSIQSDGPKEKESAVSPKNARKPKDKQTYECLLCPKTYRKRKSLIDHYKMHPGYCHDCGRPNGTTLEEIIEHNRSYHADDFPFICELCGESYSRRQQFQAHVEAHNKKDVKSGYSCVECGMEFARKKLHRQHLEEAGHKPDGAICEVCGAGFNSKIALCQHMNRVHKKDNSFECHICHNRFTMKANLERHVQLHTEIKRTYVCDQCGSSYFTYPALREHFSNAHTDVSECKCTLCGKTFSSVKSLQRHLPSHSEERPHTCNICTQNFKWKTHLVRHKQTVHGNQPMPKKLKRFAKCDEELVPVEIPPPPAKVSRKSNSKPKASSTSSSGASTKSTAGTSTKSKASPTSSASTPTTPQLESQSDFAFPVTEKTLTPNSMTATKNNHIIDMNSFNSGAENYQFEPAASYAPAQPITIKSETQQMMSYEGRYQQQGSPHAQQQQIHAQTSQHAHHHQPQVHIQQSHHQQPQVLHHQQQHLHQQLHQTTHHHHQQQQQQQHLSNQLHHSQQQPHHQQPPQSRMQSPRRHIQSPHGLLQSPQPHLQSPQPHLQQQAPPHIRHAPTQPTHHHPHPQHLQHPSSHLAQQSHLPQPSQQQNHHHSQQMQYASEWHNINYNPAATPSPMNSSSSMESTKQKYFPVIEVTSNDFIGLPMAEMPKSEQQQQQQTMDTAELLSFQNMWSGNNQQLNFNNGNIESNTYNNIGSILTNLELIGNNSSMDFNNYDIMSEHQMGTQQLQHHAYMHQDIDPNSGNMNHPVINYDYSSQNHTITDLSNTMQDQKNDFPYHQAGNYEHTVATAGGVYNPSENEKVILPPLADYMHPAAMQQQQQQPGDVNIVYYPAKN